MSSRKHNISWAQFELCNQSVQTAFERMCRLLFNRLFFGNRALLHSNPNNPGIEVEPIIETNSNKRISFQAKYLSKIDYKQIRLSAEKAVNYYADDLDVLYFYCNRDLMITSKQYRDIVEFLAAHNIEFILINNQTILDQVFDYPIIATRYFNYHNLTSEWFSERLETSLDFLGVRFNKAFNVDTRIEEQIDLFTKNAEAISRINRRKAIAIDELRESQRHYGEYTDLANKICITIESMDDVVAENITCCLDWSHTIKNQYSGEINELNRDIEQKRNALAAMSEKLNYVKHFGLERDIHWMEHLADSPSLLEFSKVERNLLQSKIIIVRGHAGVGKSQLFANAAGKNLRNGVQSLLLLGHTYLTDDPISLQIPSELELDLSIDELLSVLEGIGEEEHQCIVVFIDAINESGNKEIWKAGLNQIFNKIEKLSYVRLAISVRSGFEPLVFDSVIENKMQSGEIVRLNHVGFQAESIKAIEIFLNYYKIPFSPEYALQHEMTNPLFLMLFCKTYNGEDFDINSIFERLIEIADKEAQKAVGLDGSSAILKHLIDDIVEYRLNSGTSVITLTELLELSFWNMFGLSNGKIQFISAVERSGLLLRSVYKEVEMFYFGYNLLDDFIIAKRVIYKHQNVRDLREYLASSLLKIENGRITNYSMQDAVVIICSLCVEKFGTECIDIIDEISDEFDRQSVVDRYVDSFLWRKAGSIDSEAFITFLAKNKVSAEKVWRVFIGNSTKPNHPLNTVLFHAVMLNKTISNRDCLWTTFINHLYNEEERIYQLVTLFEKGNNLDGLSDDNLELLLILFSWLLTSSNRYLRDKTSKAMIEILKVHFHLCRSLLMKFENVNDPYVIQRLYGVVFGASMKRTGEYRSELKALSEYVFITIFNKSLVFPDILLRDYARLIVERWLYEFPDDNDVIDIQKIRPPYRSDGIPVVEKEEYYQKSNEYSGFNDIDFSMRPEGVGMYGDFGRYIFQAAAKCFQNVDMENLYHYAMQYIRDVLGYEDKLFGGYDTFRSRAYYSRHETRKVERIGKKYQWIAMYNILARISDKNLLGCWTDEPYPFEGAWELDVRDFDPTLNCNFLIPPDLPEFSIPEFQCGDFFGDSFNETEVRTWAKEKCEFFDNHFSKLMMNDNSDQAWVLLNQFEKISNTQMPSGQHASRGFSAGSQELWSMSHGYIIEQKEFEILIDELCNKNFMGRWFPEGAQNIYQLFSREYMWSPGFQSFFGDCWRNYMIDNGELLFDDQEWGPTSLESMTLGRIMPAYSNYSWGEQYDASQDESISFDIPCKDILNFLRLRQNEFDGYYHSEDGSLVAFDGRLSSIYNGLFIRRDYLSRYLKENGFRLFWTCLGEKQYFLGDTNQIYGEWSGVYYLDDDKIIGSMKCMEIGPMKTAFE